MLTTCQQRKTSYIWEPLNGTLRICVHVVVSANGYWKMATTMVNQDLLPKQIRVLLGDLQRNKQEEASRMCSLRQNQSLSVEQRV
eukprot:XP_001709764.1 Hypothetical protein GL50803_91303 [Giardia lamblia ATCC 50803]